MQKLLEALQTAYPKLQFTPGEKFLWSPETGEVIYDTNGTDQSDIWALLHETGHAVLAHASYKTDIELLKMEISAWEKAHELGQAFDINIDNDHVQDCIDTYRDWLHARAICPSCTTRCLQQAISRRYRCHNCHTTWKVTPARFTRAYRSVTPTDRVVSY